MYLSFFSSSWGRGMAAICDCDFPCLFLHAYIGYIYAIHCNHVISSEDNLHFDRNRTISIAIFITGHAFIFRYFRPVQSRRGTANNMNWRPYEWAATLPHNFPKSIITDCRMLW